MKIALYPQYSALNAAPVFKSFIEHLKDKKENFVVDSNEEADVAVIWSVLWRGRMSDNKLIWDRKRSQGKPED